MAFSYSYRAPSARSSSSSSETYEYDGLDDMMRKMDEAAALRGQKSAALYAGDIKGSLAANSRIRGLLDAISAYRSGSVPLSRLRSRSSSISMDVDGPETKRAEDAKKAEPVAYKPREEKVLGKPKDVAGLA